MMMSLPKRALLVLVLCLLTCVGVAGELSLQAEDERLVDLITRYYYSTIVAKVYSNATSKEQLLDDLQLTSTATKDYAAFLTGLPAGDPRKHHLPVAATLQGHLTKIRATLLHDGYHAALPLIEELFSVIDLLLNSVTLEVTIEVKRFTTKFVVLSEGTSLGKKTIVGLHGSVFYQKDSIQNPKPARFAEFLQEKATGMTIAINLPLDDRKLVELEKLPDLYGYPKKRVRFSGSLRLFQVVTKDGPVMVPELMKIHRITY